MLTPFGASAAAAICRTLSSNFLVAPGLTRTAAQPASMSAVSVVVMDRTEIGALPPTGTAMNPLPIMTCRQGRRRGVRGASRPSATGVTGAAVVIALSPLSKCGPCR